MLNTSAPNPMSALLMHRAGGAIHPITPVLFFNRLSATRLTLSHHITPPPPPPPPPASPSHMDSLPRGAGREAPGRGHSVGHISRFAARCAKLVNWSRSAPRRELRARRRRIGAKRPDGQGLAVSAVWSDGWLDRLQYRLPDGWPDGWPDGLPDG